MSSPTSHKIAYGCLGVIATLFVLLFAVLSILPEDEEEPAPSTAAEDEGPKPAAELEQWAAENWTEDCDTCLDWQVHGAEVWDDTGSNGVRVSFSSPYWATNEEARRVEAANRCDIILRGAEEIGVIDDIRHVSVYKDWTVDVDMEHLATCSP